MLYQEFLKGTGAVQNEKTFAEYQRVEQIYMESDHMTKEDAYRMAVIETEKSYEARMKKERKAEIAWVSENIMSGAAYIRGMARLEGQWGADFVWFSPCGNEWKLVLWRSINCGSVMLYKLFVNGKEMDYSSTGYNGSIPSAEFETYRADWHDKSLKELEDLFGYIA